MAFRVGGLTAVERLAGHPSQLKEAGQPSSWGMMHPDYGPARGSNLPPLQKLPPAPGDKEVHPSKESPRPKAKPGKSTKQGKKSKGMRKNKSLNPKVPMGGVRPSNINKKKTQKKPKER